MTVRVKLGLQNALNLLRTFGEHGVTEASMLYTASEDADRNVVRIEVVVTREQTVDAMLALGPPPAPGVTGARRA